MVLEALDWLGPDADEPDGDPELPEPLDDDSELPDADEPEAEDEPAELLADDCDEDDDELDSDEDDDSDEPDDADDDELWPQCFRKNSTHRLKSAMWRARIAVPAGAMYPEPVTVAQRQSATRPKSS